MSGRGADTRLDEPVAGGPDSLGKKAENDFGMLHFVCAWITYRAAGLRG